jgi:hypothetical protein
MIIIIKNLILLALLVSNVAFATPSHFSSVVGSALVCRDQISAEYFNDYMTTYFGKPAFTSGGANWWKVDDKLFNSEVEYIIVGLDQDFIGATFKDDPDKLMTKLRDYMGMDYSRMDVEKWVAPTAGVIIKYYDKATPSKMYCIGSPHTPVSS